MVDDFSVESRRAFMTKMPALVSLCTMSGTLADTVAKDKIHPGESPAVGRMPCSDCDQCLARFCRHNAARKARPDTLRKP